MIKKTSEEDLLLWRQVSQTIKPLNKKEKYLEASSKRRSIPLTKPVFEEVSFGDLEILESQKISKKQSRVKRLKPEATLDLHGYTRQEASMVLERFLIKAQYRGITWVLIITGKGKFSPDPEQRGVLRSFVPLWLNQSSRVSSFAQAKPEHGGEGAFYVRLKRL